MPAQRDSDQYFGVVRFIPVRHTGVPGNTFGMGGARPAIGTPARLAQQVFERALVLAVDEVDLAEATLDLRRLADNDSVVLERARALCTALARSEAHNRAAIGAVTLLALAIRG